MRNFVILLIAVMAFAAFGQTKSIGIWVEYVDYDGEYVNILDALDSATEFDYELHEYWDYMDIPAESLALIDVFIVPELETGGSSMGRPAGLYLASILEPWVEGGGLLIAMYSHGKDFICGAGFDSIGGTGSSVYSSSLSLILPSHPIAEGVASSFTGMNASYAYSYYGDYTPVVTNASSYMHTGFQEFGAGAVVFFGWDYFDAVTPNQDRLMQNAITIWGNASEGPILREIFPPVGSYTSVDTPIVMFFQDEDGIDISEFSVDINGTVYTGSSPEVSLVGDSVFIELSELPEGPVEILILQVADTEGHFGPDTVNTNTFYVDKTPPALVMNYPSGVLTSIPTGAEIRFVDALSGSNHENWILSMPGDDHISAGDPAIIAEDDSLFFVIFSGSGIIITPNDTNWVEFQVWDNPDIGESNDTTYRWWFYPQVDGIGENALPEHSGLWVSPNPFNSACRVNAPDGAEIQIYDVNGKLVDRLAPGTRYWTPSEDIGTGVYLLRMKSAQGEYFHKAVYAK